MKVNVGCGAFPLEGFVNVDMHCSQADVIADFRTLEYEDVEEVRMIHLLEHLPWRDSIPSLSWVRGWMRAGGLLVVEVPDMLVIMAVGANNDAWVPYVYGSQDHEGEFHKTGFTPFTLRQTVIEAGFEPDEVRRFYSEEGQRMGFPCLEITAHA